MAPPLRLDYAVNDADVIAAFKRQQAEIEKERKSRQELEKQINSNAAAQKTADKQALESSKKLQAEQAKLAADAAKLSEAARTPMQTYKQGLAELVDHYRSGRISQDVYRASVDKLKESYDQATGKTERAKEALRLSNEETKEAKRIIDALKTPQQHYMERIGRIEKLHASGKLSSHEYTAAIAAEKKQLAETGEAADKSGGMIGGLTGKMAGFVGGLTSASAVIALLKSEYDALIERQGKSRDANISLAAEQEALLMNLGDASAKDVTNQIRDLSKSSGVKEENVTRAVNEAMAARSDLEIKDVLAAVGTASKVRKFAPTELAGLASATIDTQKQTGLSTDASLGFLMQMQAQSRTKSLKGLAENFTPAVGGVMNFGADRQTAGAMLAALSHGMGDSTGAQTGTSAIQLAKQLREFSGGKDIGETIANLQQDKGMREKFLAGASFEAKALPAIESLLSGGTQAKQFASAREALKSDPTETLKQAIGNRDLPAMNLAAQDQALANVNDQQKLADIAGGSAAVNRDRIKEFRQQAGNMGLSTTIKGYADDLLSGGGMSTEQTIRAMQSEIDQLKSGKSAGSTAVNSLLGSGVAGLAASSFMESRNASSEETKKQVEFLQQLVDIAKQQLDANSNKAHAGVLANRAAENREGR